MGGTVYKLGSSNYKTLGQTVRRTVRGTVSETEETRLNWNVWSR